MIRPARSDCDRVAGVCSRTLEHLEPNRQGAAMAAIPTEMSVIEISAPGGPEVLKPARRAVPKPAAGEVLVRVEAVGVNGPDLMQRKGLYPPPAGASDLLGLEIS